MTEPDESEIYHAQGIFVSTEQFHDEAVTKIQQLLKGTHIQADTPTMALLDIRLPKIEIPKFSGNFTTWPNFRELFTKIIDSKIGLSGAEKLQYLKSSLIGAA